MSKKIKLLLVTLFILISAFVTYKNLKSSKHFEKSIQINTSPNKIWGKVNTIQNIKLWMPYTTTTKSTLIAYSGTAGEIGSAFTWNGLEDVGEGKLTLVDKKIPTESLDTLEQEYEITYTLEKYSPEAFRANMKITIEAYNNNTSLVTWQIDYKLPLSFKSVFSNASESLQKLENSFNTGLVQLKQITEAIP